MKKEHHIPSIHRIKKVFSIYISGKNTQAILALKTELKTRFKKNVRVFIFNDDQQCIQRITAHTELVILHGFSKSEDNLYTNEIEMRRRIRRISPDTEVIIPYSDRELSLAIDSLKFLARGNYVCGQLMLILKPYVITPLKAFFPWLLEQWIILASFFKNKFSGTKV